MYLQYGFKNLKYTFKKKKKHQEFPSEKQAIGQTHYIGDKPLATWTCTTRPLFSLLKEHFCNHFLNLGWPLDSLAK